jgi:hypothetical protein
MAVDGYPKTFSFMVDVELPKLLTELGNKETRLTMSDFCIKGGRENTGQECWTRR